MRAILTLIFCFSAMQAYAASSCWLNCADGKNSTTACAAKCGVNGPDDESYCQSYCEGRGGRTCPDLCANRSRGNDCVFHPEKYGCHSIGDSYCTFHQEVLGCHEPGDSYCTFHRDADGCASYGDTNCTFHPEQVGCHSPGDNYCTFHVEVVGCHEPGDNYCTFHRDADGC